MKKKLNSQAGETIAETLISLLIAALALVMLAAAMSTSSGIIVRSREKLDEYYSANEEDSGVVIKKIGAGIGTGDIIVTDSSSVIKEQNYPITYFKNDQFSKKPVIAYEMKNE
ncbi:MAG: hypothetical protein IKE58_06155 [Blautia sp.]|nr:hypothetical protein [Blautia sp.]